MDHTIFEEVDHYIQDLLAQEDAALASTVQSVEANNIPQISISATQGKMLQVFARMCDAKRILEIGTLAGYSTIWMARALPEDGELITLEYEQHHADVAKQNFAKAGLDKIITVHVGAALDVLPTLTGTFDMIFIDADKPPYAEYFEWALKLSRKGTIIIADNVIREGNVLDDQNTDDKVAGVRRFNKVLAVNDKVTATIMQTVGVKGHDGIAVAVVN